MFKQIKKRDGRIVPFNITKITDAIIAAGAVTGEFEREEAKRIALRVVGLALSTINSVPTVEEIQDIVEEVLIGSPCRKTAKSYIIYRDQHKKMREISNIADVIGKTNMMAGTSSSLEYVPVSIRYEENMDGAIKNQLSFAKEKIVELSILSEAINSNPGDKVLQDKIIGSKIDFQVDRKVRERCGKITQDMLFRKSGYPIRAAKQREMFYFPLLPVTTIGSFPQTKEIRKARSDFKNSRIDKDAL
ncbi:ATP cone domain-containing protein [Candidatus Acidulodesulfobacterium sp. H_13]|uniref:ATP cone domain-containing protein n=1 Tax=Candidatus Acidulodesulfobacterium sp. H_13 TaxID=3395470 RepID=UPI003AF4C286